MRSTQMRSGYVRCGLAGALLSVLLMVVYPAGATAQNAVSTQYNIQNCKPIVEQYKEIVSGDAEASGNGAAATVSNDLDVSRSVVINCVNGNGSGGESETNVKTSGINFQNCAPVIRQYNNIVSGGATAVGGTSEDGAAAVAEVANNVNISQNVVINCINGDNNDVGGDGDGGDKTPTPNPENGSVESAQNCPVNDGNVEETVANDKSFTVDKGTYLVDIEDLEDGATVSLESNDSTNSAGVPNVTDGQTQTFADDIEYTFTSDADDEFTVTLYGCVVAASVNNTKALPNTGGETVVEASPLSSVMVPAGALLALSSLAGIAWVTRRSRIDGER